MNTTRYEELKNHLPGKEDWVQENVLQNALSWAEDPGQDPAHNLNGGYAKPRQNPNAMLLDVNLSLQVFRSHSLKAAIQRFYFGSN